jgi:hypothetical protein
MYLQLAPVAGVPGLFAATAEVAGGEVDFAAGVEDAAGNVGYIFNKGALLTPVTPQEAEASLSVSITSPAQGEQVLLGQPLTAVYGCASAAGVESCQGPVASGGQVATGTAGTHNFTVTGSDLADNEASATHTYTVGYRFSGFRPPVGPGLNSVKGGQTVPIKWQLRDYSNGFVRALSSVRSITSRPIACPGASSTTISESATGTQVGLRYDTTSEQFVYDWRTDRAWVGTCRQLVVELTDGSQRTADFAIR